MKLTDECLNINDDNISEVTYYVYKIAYNII